MKYPDQAIRLCFVQLQPLFPPSFVNFMAYIAVLHAGKVAAAEISCCNPRIICGE